MRTLLFKISLSIWFVLWSPLLLVGLVSKKLTRAFVLGDSFGVILLSRLIVGIKYKIHKSPDAIVGPGAIIASKHMSILEVAILMHNVPNAFFILKSELMMIPIYGWAFSRMGLQPVNRARGATNMKALSDAVAKKIASGMTLVIFPEGTRSKPGQPIKMKRGLLFLAESLDLPITPVGVDTGLYYPKQGKMRSGTANIYFEPTLPKGANLDQIAESIARHSV